MALIGLLASAVLLGGCVAYKDLQPSQADVGSPVRIQLTICATDHVNAIEHAGCNFTTNVPGDAGNNDDYQVFLGFRVPAGASAPQELVSTAGEPLTFTRSPSYEQELTRLKPPPPTHVWVGYLSSPYTLAYSGMEPARQSTVAATFELPRPADGGPFQAPFSYLPVVGGREIGDAGEPAAGDPVSCPGIAGTPVACIDFPHQDALDGNLNFFGTRDFGIVAGNATASPGQTVSLPFNVRGAGAIPAGVSATVAASTGLPGVAVTPDTGAVVLGNGSDTRVTVPVAIPANATAGTYEVVLTGRLENGQERRGVAQLTVRPRPVTPDTTRPSLSKSSIKPKRFKAATRRKPKRGTDVRFTLSEAASVKLTVERCAKRAGKRKRGRCVRFKALKGSLTRPGVAGANKLRFDGRLRGRALKPGAYRLVVTPTDAAGNRGPAVKLGFAIAR